MTDQEINVAIAESLGWKCDTTSKHPNKYWYSPNGNHCMWPSDYCHDLNAMHEAEKTLSENEDRMFSHYRLPEVCGPSDEPGVPLNKRKAIHAAARQRAEAFLRVKGLWKE